MIRYTVNNLINVTQGKIIGGVPRGSIKGISINSQEVKKGNLFVAIKGENYDGHDFIPEALQNGAQAVILSNPARVIPQNVPMILVKDSPRALGMIAHDYRKKFDIPVIAITGSTGKTTTKEMITLVLRWRYNVLRNVKSYNNHIGVPLTLFKLNKQHDIVVLELGTNCFGDIRYLAKICVPTVAVFTNIGKSHLQLLKTPRNVFKEKYDLVNFLSARGTIIFNNDDRFLKTIRQKQKGHSVITFGIQAKADYRAQDVSVKTNRSINFRVNRQHNFQLATTSLHNVYNALAAISCGRLFKIGYNDIKKALKRFSPLKGRGSAFRIHGFWVMDDTYNANPVSFQSALKNLGQIKTKGRRILVCADMLELGPKAREFHQQIGREAVSQGIDCVFATGKLAKHIIKAIKEKKGKTSAAHYDSLTALHQKLLEYCQPKDVILVKASRGMRLERTVKFLKDHLK